VTWQFSFYRKYSFLKTFAMILVLKMDEKMTRDILGWPPPPVSSGDMTLLWTSSLRVSRIIWMAPYSFIRYISHRQKKLRWELQLRQFQSAGDPHYMRSYYMKIRYMRANFWSPCLSHITRSTCISKCMNLPCSWFSSLNASTMTATNKKSLAEVRRTFILTNMQTEINTTLLINIKKC